MKMMAFVICRLDAKMRGRQAKIRVKIESFSSLSTQFLGPPVERAMVVT